MCALLYTPAWQLQLCCGKKTYCNIYIYTNKASLVLLKINVLAFSGPKPSKYEVLLFVIQGIFAFLTAAALEGEVPQAQWRPRASRRLAGGRPELLGRVLQIEAEETWREILS